MKSEPEQTGQKMGNKLTDRDIEILNFINHFGFCEIPHIEKRFSVKRARPYQLMQRLIKMGLVKHERIFHGRHGVYRLSRKGASSTSLPYIDEVRIGNYKHQLAIIDVFLKLRCLHPDADWISERQLQHEKFFNGVGKRGHLADGILVLPGNKPIAIEVELTLKGKDRLDEILKNYRSQFDFVEVWYFCLPKLLPCFTSLAGNSSIIKIYNIEEFLA